MSHTMTGVLFVYANLWSVDRVITMLLQERFVRDMPIQGNAVKNTGRGRRSDVQLNSGAIFTALRTKHFLPRKKAT